MPYLPKRKTTIFFHPDVQPIRSGAVSSEGTEEEEEEGGGRNAAGCSLLWLSDPSAPLLAKNIDAPPDRRMRGTMSAAAVAVWLGSGTYRP